MITQQNPQLVTTNLASVYLLFCTHAARQDLGIQWPREHCCQVTSLKVFQHQELRLTSILLNQLHFSFSSAKDSKSTPLPPLFPGACLAVYLIHPLNHSSIRSNIYWAPTMCQMPCREQRQNWISQCLHSSKTARCWEMMKIKEIGNKQKILVTGCDPRHFLPTSPAANVFYWGKIHVTLN